VVNLSCLAGTLAKPGDTVVFPGGKTLKIAIRPGHIVSEFLCTSRHTQKPASCVSLVNFYFGVFPHVAFHLHLATVHTFLKRLSSAVFLPSFGCHVLNISASLFRSGSMHALFGQGVAVFTCSANLPL
jgi:hypothetical protein